jgi:macrodomain Ter protein organizer (MatP/YcbG family)
MSYMLIRDLEPLLWLQIAKSARKNKRSLSDEALILMQRGLAEKKKRAADTKQRGIRMRRIVNDRS